MEIIAIATGKAMEFVRNSEILYCRADGNYTVIHLVTGKTLTSAKTLKEVELALPHEHFLRIHHSFIANLEHIHSFQNEPEACATMTDGRKLSISRSRKKEFLERFTVL